MNRDREYWAKRARKRENESYQRGSRLTARLFEEYQKAAKAIRMQVNDFYTKYATKYDLTYEETIRKLNKSEYQEWKQTLAEYVDKIAQESDPHIKAQLTAQLDALSYNSQITRLEALHGQIDLILNDLYDHGKDQMKAEFGDAFQEGYYKKIFDIQSRVGFIQSFAKLDEAMIEDVLSYPWSGAMFSDRLWQNKQALTFYLRETLTQGLMQGKGIAAISKQMSDKMGQSYKAAERLVRTEMAHFHGESDKAAYDAVGIEEYEYMATLDMRTCEVCGALDGKHFMVSEAQEGINYPPMHPNDRCTTVEYDPEDALDWYNTGKPMPPDMTYEKWYEEQVGRNGQGFVEVERKKAYNRTADTEQYDAYVQRLGKDAPNNFAEFYSMKYSQTDAWAELKGFYSYKGRVPEATKADFALYQKIKETGIYGTARVPPAAIDISALSFNTDHVFEHGHSATEDEAKSFIENAVFSLKRKHWTGDVFTNYYSPEGAAYVLNAENEIRTAFKRDQFNDRVKDAMEVCENEK